MAAYQKEDELDRLLVQLEGTLMKYETCGETLQNEKYSEGILIYERIKCAEEAYLVQIEGLQTQSKISHMKRLQEKQELLRSLKVKLDALKVIVDNNEHKHLDTGNELNNLSYNAKLIVWGNDLQDRTQESINRIRDLTIESEKIGADVTADLEMQSEKLNAVKSTVHDIDENIISANATIKQIARSIFRDKCTIILIIVIILLATGIGLLAFLSKDK
ncbi:hypothetical protein BEWA_002540 [Theileria equi strain WA]|uniref:t-SNARE coiled-coil homology domain-containing protein n=1 Tax=Theileria equi strain WA TaxID=1537102 RepID=L0AZ33_THEEQ|nr:hypothetical protein BEWA_002540 [Theileria equi strain WA]AFZ80847.1 hypothetical protein BEWA_002540 [Theileria equi strain WA]|eukprot:XP_004830513.1 hypothetical protein BEWA_002540 [Theileria equi strain WA]